MAARNYDPADDIATKEVNMLDSKESRNKGLVLKAFDVLFNKRDYAEAERYWSPRYIQHSAHIEPGRDGLFQLIKSSPPSLKYEPGVIVADGDFVIIHGRFSGLGAGPRIGLQRTSFTSRTESWSNTGMSFNTKPLGSSPRAGCRCLAMRSRNNPRCAK